MIIINICKLWYGSFQNNCGYHAQSIGTENVYEAISFELTS